MSEKTQEDVMSKSAPIEDQNDDKVGSKSATHCPKQLTNCPTSEDSITCNSVINIPMSNSENLVTMNEDSRQKMNRTKESSQQITGNENGKVL